MRFTRYPKCIRESATPQRMAAARKAVAQDRERCGLFPEMMQFKSAEERVAKILDHRVTWWQEMRDIHAKKWREVRRLLATIPPISRQGVIRYWQTSNIPGDPYYLASLIRNVTTKHHSCWHELAHRRRLQLIGQGKMEAPWKKHKPVK